MIAFYDTAKNFQRVMYWDDENRLTRSFDTTNGGSVATVYEYDTKGMRIIKDGPYGKTLYLDTGFVLSNEYLVSNHVFVGNTRIASVVKHKDEAQAAMYFYASDHLGSSSVLTNQAGGYHERIEYLPYGEVWFEDALTKGGYSTPYKFTGKELDKETGWYYFGARYYDPRTAVWGSVDPALGRYLPQAPVSNEARKQNENLPGRGGIFNPVNMNVYHYAGLNPVRIIDIDGNAAGDLFSNIDDAAKDFGKTYNDDSIRDKVEYGTTIYKTKDGKFYYSIPNKGDYSGVSSDTCANDPKHDVKAGNAHTHGNYDVNYDGNNFSNYIDPITKEKKGDISNADKRGRPSYVATPNGSLKKYDPSTKKINIIAKDLPSDPKDPTRLNKEDPSKGKVDPHNEK